MTVADPFARLRARSGPAPVLGAQYFRPPFPDRRRWDDDLREMLRAGLSTAYAWVCWGWVEPEPGRYAFDDYDALIATAHAAGLNVVLSTIAEIHPFWIHREIPKSQLVNHRNEPVVSMTRRECQVGLTPGGCFDHPEVRERMRQFLDQVARRYASADGLLAWDVWNETRWAVHSEGHVCYCQHTLTAFREWLQRRYGTLERLNDAWGRRYSNWSDVDAGRKIGSSYTDHIEFQSFLTDRATEHMRMRYETVRNADPDSLIVAHGMSPAPFGTPYENEQALSRGNDWDYSDFLDGFGGSLFPAWIQDSGAELGTRLEVSRAAAQDRVFWVAELQGGSARGGFEVNQPVTGPAQQRWVWRSYARGAKAVTFWCWRDEIFGRESSGFGVVGNDGHADERIRGLQHTRALLDAHAELVGNYQPDPAVIGVVFEPAAYQMDWAQNGPGFEQSKDSLLGYLYAFERLQLPYEVIESNHRDRLPSCRFIVMPWPLIVEPELASELADWVRSGGFLLVESELDAFDLLGFYRYPDERPFAAELGVRSLGRRPIPDLPLAFDADGERGTLPFASWAEPLGNPGASEFLVRRRLGEGSVIAVGTFAGLAYMRGERDASGGLEQLLRLLATESAALPGIGCDRNDGEQVTLRTGTAGDQRLVFVTDEQPGRELRLCVSRDLIRCESVEALAGSVLAVLPGAEAQTVVLRTDEWGIGIARWDV